MAVVEGGVDEQGYRTIVYERRRATTTYDKNKVLAIIPREDWIKYGIVKPNDAVITKYLQQHPELKDKILPLKGYTKPFLSTKKKQ